MAKLQMVKLFLKQWALDSTWQLDFGVSKDSQGSCLSGNCMQWVGCIRYYLVDSGLFFDVQCGKTRR